jgi:SAM-dependent methyltransferase
VGVSLSGEELFQPETLALIEQLEADNTPEDLVRTISRLRSAGHPQQRVHHAIEQVRLRRKARAKCGEFASSMLFTEAGLEQATRLSVAAHHAGRFQRAGVTRVADLGCGLGMDSLAFAALGFHVLSVEKDPLTAAIASFNLASFDRVRVVSGDALSVDLSEVDGLWLDPARRDGATRIDDPEAYSPTLTEAMELARKLPAGIKLAPGMDRGVIPDDVEAQWVSHRGEVVEMVWWFGALAAPGVRRSALVMSDTAHLLSGADDSPDAAVGELGQYLYEPDGAVIRARLIGDLVRSLAGHMIDPTIAYFTTSEFTATPFAQAFEVERVLPAKHKELSRWVRENGIGTLEIKKRGVDIDPSQFRHQLPLSGDLERTLIVTRVAGKKVAIAARRVSEAS